MFIDSHCHLSFPELSSRVDDIRRDMRARGVVGALCICTTLEEYPELEALVRDRDDLWSTVGVHPDNEGVSEPTERLLIELGSRPKVVGIGETGLDYFRLGARTLDDMSWQRDRYRAHIRAAHASGLPLVVHTRNASQDTIAILRHEGQGEVGGVFHCFTETRDVAREALDLGFMISFSGIVTFRNAGDLREVAAFVPLDRCLIETDSPYLAPVPYRGKVNTPALVPWVAEAIASIRGIAIDAVAEATTENFFRLFTKATPPFDRATAVGPALPVSA